MLTTRTAHRAGTLFSTFLLAAVTGGSTAQASVIVGLVLNPSSTAGGGATSTRSGNGSWQLYAIESADSTDFGISSYNIALSGTTAINHRSPLTTINDSNGDPWPAGFNLLRTATNVNPIQASQSLPGSTPFLITGFGQSASDFITKSTAIDAGALVVGPTTSGVWGNYNSAFLTAPALTANGATAAAAAVNAGRKWIFLAEGLGPSGLTQITSAVFTVFTNTSGASAATTTEIIDTTPCLACYPPTIQDLVINNVVANDPGSVEAILNLTSPAPLGPFTWSNFTFDSYVPSGGASGTGPAIPAAFDTSAHKFTWNTVGSPLGTYKWSVQASNTYGTDTGFVTVNITGVPEPATWSFAGLSLLCHLCLIRRRSGRGVI